MKARVWLVAAYGCESWTLRKNEETRLDAFERTEKDSAGLVESKANKCNGGLTMMPMMPWHGAPR